METDKGKYEKDKKVRKDEERKRGRHERKKGKHENRRKVKRKYRRQEDRKPVTANRKNAVQIIRVSLFVTSKHFFSFKPIHTIALAWEPGVAQVTHSYSRRLPALNLFYQETKGTEFLTQTQIF